MECTVRLLLQLHMLHARAATDNDFRCRVTEVDDIREAHVLLDHRAFSTGLGDHQTAWVSRNLPLSRNEQDLHRRGAFLVSRNPYEGAVSQMARIDRGKYIAVEIKLAGKQWFDDGTV